MVRFSLLCALEQPSELENPLHLSCKASLGLLGQHANQYMRE